MRYTDFQTGHFADFKQFKVDIDFVNFGQVKIDPICSLLLLWTGHSYCTEFGQDMPQKNNPNPLPLIKIQELCIGSCTRNFQ